ADGTATGRLWESKSPPTPNNKHNKIQKQKEGDGKPPSPSFSCFAILLTMDQKQISHVADQVEQGILGLEGVDKLLAYLDSLHPDDLVGVDFLVDRMFEEERNQIWELTETLKEFLADLKECQK
ncbi:hypothetical protein, partial [Corynebacterium tuberculostearicum]|uniref:hypothetical protein n=1 Tax=Corynebacterium tuberculostearicum TaxID=38304 RepID=UPI00254A1C66